MKNPEKSAGIKWIERFDQQVRNMVSEEIKAVRNTRSKISASFRPRTGYNPFSIV